MFAPVAFASLMILASAGPTITQLDEERFRVGIVYDDKSVRGHANAQMAIIRAATKHCKGKGSAVSEGTLTLNNAEPLRSSREALDLSEVYTCQPKD